MIFNIFYNVPKNDALCKAISYIMVIISLSDVLIIILLHGVHLR